MLNFALQDSNEKNYKTTKKGMQRDKEDNE
jgi:hypothetical protein